MGLDKEDLFSISRVKGKLEVIFLSDMVTADGKHLETFACDPGDPEVPQREQEKYLWTVTRTGRRGKLLASTHSGELPTSHALGSLDFMHTQKMDLIL